MPNFLPFRMPYWNFPYYNNYYRRKYYSNPNPKINPNEYKKSEGFENSKNVQQSSDKNNEDKNSTTRTNSSSTNNSYSFNDEPYLNILGLDLFSDDILILCILLFLYTEGIKDEMLFICLILLLLS